MQISPRTPSVVPTPPPLPPLPLTFHDAPQPDDGLLQTMEAGFPQPPHVAAEVQRLCRDNLPATVGNFFPHPNTPLIETVSAARAMLFALRLSTDALPQDPGLQPFLDRFCTCLEEVGIIAAWSETALPEQDAPFCDSWLMPHLQRREPLIMQGGYSDEDSGHATRTMFLPAGEQHTYVVVLDRARAPYHPRQSPHHPLPLVYQFETEALTGPAGRAFVLATLALQRPEPGHSLDGYHAALETLLQDAHGDVLVGFNADDSVQQALEVHAQSELKSDTCTISSSLAALNFAMHAHFGTLDPAAPPSRRDAVQAMYKEVKAHCRSLVLHQFINAVRHVRQQGHAEEIEMYEAALQRTRDYVLARLHKPWFADYAAALKTV